MLGSVAKCQNGILGIICDIRIEGLREIVYRGVTFNGRSWQTSDPIIISRTVNDYIQGNFLEKNKIQETRLVEA